MSFSNPIGGPGDPNSPANRAIIERLDRIIELLSRLVPQELD